MQFFVTDSSDSHESEPLFKYDVANALLGTHRLVTYQNPPEIMLVTSAALVVMGLVIGMTAMVELVLLFYTIHYRNSKTMQFCQGRILIVFLVSAIFATVASFLFNPRPDGIFCKVREPLIYIPLQLMLSILLGRLWRINAVISPILMTSMGKGKRNTMSGRFCNFLTVISKIDLCGPCRRGGVEKRQGSSIGPTSGFRVSVSPKQLTQVVAFFTSPMIVVQICRLVFEPSMHTTMINGDEEIGRFFNAATQTLNIVSLALLIFMFALLLWMSYESRQLPSVLNETKTIYHAASFSMFVVALGLFVIGLVRVSPTTSPNVEYVLSVAMVICVTLNMTLGIMLPKFKVIRRGDDIRVSKLVSDHRQKKNAKVQQRTEAATRPNAISGRTTVAITQSCASRDSHTTPAPRLTSKIKQKMSVPMPSNNGCNASVVSTVDTDPAVLTEPAEAVKDEARDGPQRHQLAVVKSAFEADNAFVRKVPTASVNSGDSSSNDSSFSASESNVPIKSESKRVKSQSSSLEGEDILPTKRSSSAAFSFSFEKPEGCIERVAPGRSKSNPERRFRETSVVSANPVTGSLILQAPHDGSVWISELESPPRRLVLRLLDAKVVFERLLNQVMYGMAVSRSDWEGLRETCTDLGDNFRDRVFFDWEEEDECVGDDENDGF